MVHRGVRKFVTQLTESDRIICEIPMIYCMTGMISSQGLSVGSMNWYLVYAKHR